MSTKDCITSWKKELEESRAAVMELDVMKVEHGPVEREHNGVVRKKSRHDSGSQVSTIIIINRFLILSFAMSRVPTLYVHAGDQ